MVPFWTLNTPQSKLRESRYLSEMFSSIINLFKMAGLTYDCKIIGTSDRFTEDGDGFERLFEDSLWRTENTMGSGRRAGLRSTRSRPLCWRILSPLTRPEGTTITRPSVVHKAHSSARHITRLVAGPFFFCGIFNYSWFRGVIEIPIQDRNWYFWKHAN